MSIKNHLYAYPVLNRAGLANLLFPWARAEVFAKEHSCPVLVPRWTQPKIGPILRGEKDWRFYTGLFDNSSFVRGVRKLRLLAMGRRFPEGTTPTSSGIVRPAIVEFRGMEHLFEPFLRYQEFLNARLRAILSNKCREALEKSPRPRVALHVRRGDFGRLQPGQTIAPKTMNTAIPEEWFLACIRQIREVVGEKEPVTVFTDAKPGELTILESEPGVKLAAPNESVVDLLLLSESKILVTSGTSSFSMWAAFLGAMPSLWYPGQLRSGLVPNQEKVCLETDGTTPFPTEFKELCRQCVVS